MQEIIYNSRTQTVVVTSKYGTTIKHIWSSLSYLVFFSICVLFSNSLSIFSNTLSSSTLYSLSTLFKYIFFYSFILFKYYIFYSFFIIIYQTVITRITPTAITQILPTHRHRHHHHHHKPNTTPSPATIN